MTIECTAAWLIPSSLASSCCRRQLSRSVPRPMTRCDGKPDSFIAKCDSTSTYYIERDIERGTRLEGHYGLTDEWCSMWYIYTIIHANMPENAPPKKSSRIYIYVCRDYFEEIIIIVYIPWWLIASRLLTRKIDGIDYIPGSLTTRSMLLAAYLARLGTILLKICALC